MRVILFANGLLKHDHEVRETIQPGDVILAADGGARHCLRLNLVPEEVIGDFDSLNQEALAELQAAGTELIRHPRRKDETDLELAMDAVIAMKPKRIWILGALGKRFDQSLANIFLLARGDFADIDLRLIDGQREIFLIRGFGQIEGVPGESVSLLPLHGPAHGVRTQGLLYPLKDETLYPDRTRGISNELIAPSAQITLQSGLLICIHAFSDTNQKGGSND